MKAVIIIGQSAAGKTTFIKKTFLDDEELVGKDKPFKYTEIARTNTCLLGDYSSNIRCLGTDTLSMSVLPKLIEFVAANRDRYDTIVADGDRITNARFFEFVQSLGVPVDLYVFSCSVEESMKRRQDSGSNPNEQFIKTTRTKSINMRALGLRLGFNVIDKYTGVQQERQGIHAFLKK